MLKGELLLVGEKVCVCVCVGEGGRGTMLNVIEGNFFVRVENLLEGKLLGRHPLCMKPEQRQVASLLEC